MHHQYALDLLTEAGDLLEHTVVTPDWQAALEWVHFEGIRDGQLGAVTRTGPGEIDPVWDARHGEPYVGGFRVTVRGPDGRTAARELPKTYLRGLAQDASVDLVKRGILAKNSTFRWVVRAVPAPGEAPVRHDDGFGVEEIAQPIPIDEAALSSFEDAVVVAGDDDEAPGQVPVFLPRAVLDQATALAIASGDLETGGVLVGKLHRDVASDDGRTPGLFVEVTAQVPAPHTRSETTKLTFTGDTWAAVRDAIALRRRGEMMMGWWHYHPDWCRLRDCPPERRRECTAASPFFSAEDVHLHATCFPAGHQVALLVSQSTAAGLTSSLFGWWEGRVVSRGFHVIDHEPVQRTTEGDVDAANPAP